jgi:hypothetical protein
MVRAISCRSWHAFARCVGAVALVLSGVSEAFALPESCVEQADRVVCYATPTGAPGFHGANHISNAGRLETILDQLGIMPKQKHIEIQLLTDTANPTQPTIYRHMVNGQQQSYLIKGFLGTDKHTLSIKGIASGDDWWTQFEGIPLDDLTGPPPDVKRMSEVELEGLPTAPRDAGDLNDYLTELGLRNEDEVSKSRREKGPTGHPLFCLEMRNSSFITLDGVSFNQCWLSAVHATEVNHLRVLRTRFWESRDGIFVMGTSDPDKARNIEVAFSRWEEDPSGAIWSSIPWGVTHDAQHATRNGSLLASRNIAGHVEFHNNTIVNAYNGIRLVGRIKKGTCEVACVERTNRSVRVYSNTFEFVRDNPIEPEGRAAGWAIFHNRFVNSHAWISLDGVRSGPIYVWGNLGWFDELPGKGCIDSSEWSTGFVYDFKKTAWLKVDPAAEYDPFCGTHRFGTVFKLGILARNEREEESLPVKVSELPDLYVFHNSWYVRSAIFRGGLVRQLGHWNNAIFFTSCGSIGLDECRVTEASTEAPYGIYPTKSGSALFYNYVSFYDPSTFDPDDPGAATPLSYTSDYNISNAGFPAIDGLDQQGRGSIVGDPQFERPDNGEFKLQTGSPALNAACAIEYLPDKRGLRCTRNGGGPFADIGAVQSRSQFGTPYFEFEWPPN